MDFVTITDPDTIDGCLALLDEHPHLQDFIIGEEVSSFVPEFKTPIRLGVFNLDETQHREIQKRKANIYDLLPYLKNEGLLYVLGHFFYKLRKEAQNPNFFSKMIELFQTFEVHHGHVINEHNIMSAYFIKSLSNKGICGGSHARTLKAIGTTYTVCHGSTKSECLQDIHLGRSSTEGRHRSFELSRQEFFEQSYDQIKHLLLKGHMISFSKICLKWPYDYVRYTYKQRAILRNANTKTPFYSALLGASQKNVCFIPKEIIET